MRAKRLILRPLQGLARSWPRLTSLLVVLGLAFLLTPQPVVGRDVPFSIAHTVNASFHGATSVYAADLDGDVDLDLAGAAYDANELAWWENVDSDGTSWSEHTVDGSFYGATSVHAADVDGDGDLDLLGTAPPIDEVTWWENVDGDGLSWSEHIVDGSFHGATSIHAADLDGDGDLDLLVAATVADDVIWCENLDGDGNTWSRHSVDEASDWATSVRAADLDADGDLDLLGAATSGDEVTWWENVDDGSTWEKHTVDGSFDGATSVHAADLDSDGDLDLLGAAYRANHIAWWENRGGEFALITTGTAPAKIPSGRTVDLLQVVMDHRGRATRTPNWSRSTYSLRKVRATR